MKIRILTPTLIPACLTGILLITGCDSRKSEVSSPEKPAPAAAAEASPAAPTPATLAEFKAGAEALVKWIDERNLQSSTTPPPAPAAMMAEFMTQAKALKPAGLPADLAQAWAAFLGVMTEVDALFKTLPTPEPTDPQARMQAMTGIQPQLMALSDKVRPVVKTLAETAKKHGIENLEKLGPGGPPPNAPPSPALPPPASPAPPAPPPTEPK